MFEKPAISDHDIHPLIARRWSGRAFDANRPVLREHLLQVLEAARWAPSCFNDQPWRFLVWDRHHDAVAWQRAFMCLGEYNRTWAEPAPVLLAVCADTLLTTSGQPNRWGGYDAGAASMALCVQATVLGLMVHQMGGFDAAKLAAEFAVPERYTPMAMIALGYQVSREQVPASLHEKEFAARSRRPLGASFFDGAWERPLGSG